MDKNYEDGMTHYRDEEYQEAMLCFYKSNGCLAVFMLGYMHHKGIYVVQSESTAMRFYVDSGIITIENGGYYQIIPSVSLLYCERTRLHNILVNADKTKAFDIIKLAQKFKSNTPKIHLYNICAKRGSLDAHHRLVHVYLESKKSKEATVHFEVLAKNTKVKDMLFHLLTTNKRVLSNKEYADWLEILLDNNGFQDKKYLYHITGINTKFLKNSMFAIKLFYKLALLGWEDGMKKLKSKYIRNTFETKYYMARIFQMGFPIRKVNDEISYNLLRGAWGIRLDLRAQKEKHSIKLKYGLFKLTINKFRDIKIKFNDWL